MWKQRKKVVYKRFSQRKGGRCQKNKEPPQRSVLITMEVMCSCKNMVRRMRMRRRRAMPMTCMEIWVLLSFLGCLLLACQHACLWGCMWVPTDLIICVGMIDMKAEFYNKI